MGDSGRSAEDHAAAVDGQSVEIIHPGELQQAVASLDDAGAGTRDGRADRQSRMDVGIGDRRAREYDRRDRERIGAGSKDQRSPGDRLREGRITGDRADRSRRGERKPRARAQGHAAGDDAARVGEGKGRQGLVGGGGKIQDPSALDGDDRAGVHGTGCVDVDLGGLVLAAAHDGHAAGGQHHVAGGSGSEGQRASVDLRAAGEIVRRRQHEGVHPVFDQPDGRARAVVADARIDGEGVLVAVDDQLTDAGESRAACGQDTAYCGGTQGGSVVIVASEQTA